MGLILRDGTIVELKNVCDDPKNGFEIDAAELLAHEENAVASWHTHPITTSNLSMGDLESFLNYPQWQHHIAGTDGVASYFVEDGKVLRCDD